MVIVLFGKCGNGNLGILELGNCGHWKLLKLNIVEIENVEFENCGNWNL